MPKSIIKKQWGFIKKYIYIYNRKNYSNMNGYMHISLTAVDKTTFPVAITAFLVHFVTAWMLRENFTNKNNGLWK